MWSAGRLYNRVSRTLEHRALKWLANIPTEVVFLFKVVSAMAGIFLGAVGALTLNAMLPPRWQRAAVIVPVAILIAGMTIFGFWLVLRSFTSQPPP